jgi:hypothetical protein
MTTADIQKHAVLQNTWFDEQPERQLVLAGLTVASEVHHEGLSKVSRRTFTVVCVGADRVTLARPGEFENRLCAVSPGAETYEGTGVFDVQLTTLDDIVSELRLSDLAFIKS